MLNCKQASELMSQAMDTELSIGKRLSLKMHVMMCRGCTNFSHQIAFLRKAAKHFGNQVNCDMPRLSEDAKNRIVRAIRDAKMQKTNGK